jgi:hypothetical protein
MEPLLVKMTKEESRRQLNFLIRKEFRLSYSSYLKPFYYIVAFSLLILLLSLLTSSEALITFKGVSIFFSLLVWAAILIFVLIIVIKIIKRIVWRNEAIKVVFRKGVSCRISFDAEKLTLITDSYKSEMAWTYYKYYDEDEISIYIIPETSLYHTVSFSTIEIGEENLAKLKEIVKEKLIPLVG